MYPASVLKSRPDENAHRNDTLIHLSLLKLVALKGKNSGFSPPVKKEAWTSAICAEDKRCYI